MDGWVFGGRRVEASACNDSAVLFVCGRWMDTMVNGGVLCKCWDDLQLRCIVAHDSMEQINRKLTNGVESG